jgi:outer membrane immunogenic protein
MEGGEMALLILALVTASAAYAGGPKGGSLKDEPYRPYSWTGAYVGLTAGYAWGESRFDDGVTSNPFDIDGWALGGTIGYNLQMHGNVVVGIEADISFSDISGSFGPGNLGQPNGAAWNCATGACVTDVNWFGTLRGRLGFVADTMLIYATGGVAYGDIDSRIRNDADWITGDVGWGWTAGAGLEFSLRPGWTAKIEYLHVDLGWTGRNAAVGLKSDAEFDLVRLGLNYRVGH